MINTGNPALRYHTITFGCQMNEHDSEVLDGLLERRGYKPEQELKKAGLILINTCCIRTTAEEKVFGLIGRLRRQKMENPGLIIGVCGCMPQQEGMAEKIKKRFPYVDLIFGTHNIHQMPEMLEKVLEARESAVEIWGGNGGIVEGLPVKRKKSIRAWVTVMYGCNNFCSYCVVPYVRGRERSRRPEDVLAEVRTLAGEGFKEVVLLGQNVNSYGKDLDATVDFASLLEKLDEAGGVGRIRFMTSHPRDFNKRLINTIASSKKVCEHIHLPVQAGSNKILKKMNRGYTRERYLELVNEIREAIPLASLTTDIMVGFPGEEEEDFNDTLDLLLKAGFDSAYTFIFNSRPGTPAAEMAGHIPEAIKKDRIDILLKLQKNISLARNRDERGRVQEILVEGEKEGSEGILHGRNRGNKIVLLQGAEELAGSVVRVMITDSHLAHLDGVLL